MENDMAKKTGFTLRLPEDLLEEVRNAIWALGNRTTITDIIEEGLEKWVEERKNERKGKDKGQPFPQREGELPYSKKRKE